MDEYLNQVKTDFLTLDNQYRSTKRNGTSCKDVLQFLVDHHKERIWWWSWELIGQKTSTGGFLSHRAPARASDLAIHNPELVEDKKIGRFSVYRVRRENRDKVVSYLGLN